MSAGFFLTATNKLGIPVASDSDHSTDYDSEEEREIVRRKRIQNSYIHIYLINYK